MSTPEQLRTLKALTERILPSEDGPGAREAEVWRGVDGALQHRVYQGMAPLIHQGLEMLDQLAVQAGDAPFADCDPSVQDLVLQHLHQSPQPQARFFLDTLIRLCLEAFLGDPRHGGNRDQAGWRFVGLRGEDLAARYCREPQRTS